MSTSSLSRIDALVTKMEARLGATPTAVDIDDPWGTVNIGKSTNISKMKCSDCDYILTKPFEVRCPSCYFKRNQGKFPEVIELKPLQLVTQKSSAAASTSTSSSSKTKQSAAKAEPAELKQFDDLCLTVCKVVSARAHPKAERLLITQLDDGSATPRQVVAGLVGHYTPEELTGKLVVVITNLAPVKLRNETSQGMIMAGESSASNVKILTPAEGSKPGDRVYLQGSKPSANYVKDLSIRMVGFIAQQQCATYKGTVMCTDSGPVSCPLEDGSNLK